MIVSNILKRTFSPKHLLSKSSPKPFSASIRGYARRKKQVEEPEQQAEVVELQEEVIVQEVVTVPVTRGKGRKKTEPAPAAPAPEPVEEPEPAAPATPVTYIPPVSPIPADEIQYHPRYKVVVVDIEATGRGSPKNHRIIEVAAVKLVNGVKIATFSSLINPKRLIPEDVQVITGITSRMCQMAPLPEQVLQQLAYFMEDSIVVAHNSSFDVAYIREEMLRFGIANVPESILMEDEEEGSSSSGNKGYKTVDIVSELKSRESAKGIICTIKLCRRLFPELSNYRLENMVDFFTIKQTGKHRAGPDAETTAQLWRNIYKHCVMKLGFSPPMSFFLKLTTLQKKEVEPFFAEYAEQYRQHEENEKEMRMSNSEKI